MSTFDKSLAKDQISYTTITGFGFWDRLRILFGKHLTITSTIYTSNEVSVLGSEATPAVARFFNPQQIQMVIRADAAKIIGGAEDIAKKVEAGVVEDIKDGVAKL